MIVVVRIIHVTFSLFQHFMAQNWAAALCSDIYHLLVRVCLGGSRRQAKFAISAIAAIMGPSDDFSSSELCKVNISSGLYRSTFSGHHSMHEWSLEKISYFLANWRIN